MLVSGLTTLFVNLMGSTEPVKILLLETLKKNPLVANPWELKPL